VSGAQQETIAKIDSKLKIKYSFLFKDHENLTAGERRWKWVKTEYYPEDLVQLIKDLSRGKKPTEEVEEGEKHKGKIMNDPNEKAYVET
jgi:hypothetical protein